MTKSTEKPDWKDAPAWAMWLAQNHIGTWAWFENKPEATPIRWDYNPNFQCGRYRAAGKPDDWQDTLEPRP